MPAPALRFLLPLLLLTAVAQAGSPVSDITTNLLPYQLIEGHQPFELSERMAHYKVPGLGIAVIEDGAVIWTGYFGRLAVDGDALVDEQTLFGMGSLSKAVTSACVLNAAREGLIQVDAPLNPQLRTWRLPAHEWSSTRPVTPALLMNHSGGLPHRRPHLYPVEGIPTARQMLRGERPSRQPPLTVTMEPGSRFQYSNGGYTVLQVLIEDATGQDFPTAAAARIFEPLQLQQTTFLAPLPPDRLAHAASGHRDNGAPISDTRSYIAHMAAGGLWASAPDYARFVIEIQKAAAGESSLLMDQAQARRMIAPGPATQYGLGVFLYEGNGSEPYFSHIGDGGGFVAGFAAHRERGCGVVVTTNGSGGINLCREIIRSVASVRQWPGFLPPVQQDHLLPEEELDTLAGRYLVDFDQIIQLDQRDGHLRFSRDGVPGLTMYQVARDTFVVVERKGEIVLDRLSPRVTLQVHLSDAIGRLGDQATEAVRLQEGEKSPLDRLLTADEDGAFDEYLDLARSRPDHPSIDENRINRLGYNYLRGSRLREALRVFKLNTLLYPSSGNVHDSYGEALLEAGRAAEAIASYRRSLDLDPGNGNARRVLRELGVEL